MFKIIAETSDFVIVDKNANVNFHDEGNLGEGLFSQVKNQLNNEKTLFPVHRLDKMTSGLIIFAKTLTCAQEFQKMFTAHEVEKYYLAISDIKPNKKQGLIKGDMAKSRRGMWKLLRTMKNPALTQFLSYRLETGMRLFLVKPHSGKTHQIRVALKSVGSPIMGDQCYHPASNEQIVDRGYLHAYALRFTYLGQVYQYIVAPSQGAFFLNAIFKNTLNALTDINKPWSLNWPRL